MNSFGNIFGRVDVSVRVTIWSAGRSPAGIVALLPSGSVNVPPELALMVWEVVAIVPETTTFKEADLLESVTLVAVRETTYGFGSTAGAV